MKKFNVVLLALFAVFAFSATIVASASAEEATLLAEWLLPTGPVTASMATTTSGGLLLEDTKTIAGAAAVLCEATADGSVGPNGEGETTEILNLAGEKIGVLGGLALLGNGAAAGQVGSECVTETRCAAGTAASPIEVWPVGLPWLILLYLMVTTGEILALITTEVADAKGLLAVGYELLCLVLGLNTEDTCVSDNFDIQIANDADTLDASILGGSETTPLAECSQSGELSGKNVADELTPILLTSGELLTVSSE